VNVSRRALLAAPLALALPRGLAQAAPGDPYATLLAEEHAAIHLYGVLGPHLAKDLREAARAAYDDHRRHRDLLVDAVRAAGATPVPPRVTYAPPLPVDGPSSAGALAVRIEDSLALRWHGAVHDAKPADRGRAAGAFGDECVHLALLRRHGPLSAAAQEFPGR
jgi:hypothetical protein